MAEGHIRYARVRGVASLKGQFYFASMKVATCFNKLMLQCWLQIKSEDCAKHQRYGEQKTSAQIHFSVAHADCGILHCCYDPAVVVPVADGDSIMDLKNLRWSGKAACLVRAAKRVVTLLSTLQNLGTRYSYKYIRDEYETSYTVFFFRIPPSIL
jgi:hypothetical protein